MKEINMSRPMCSVLAAFLFGMISLATAQAASPAPSSTPSPKATEAAKEVDHHSFFIGVSGANLEVLAGSSENTKVRFNATVGYLPSAHHMFTLGYTHEPAVIQSETIDSTNLYLLGYRYFLTEKAQHSFFGMVNVGAYRLAGGPSIPGANPNGTSSTYFVTSFGIGKNFDLFDSESFVYSPTIVYEKVESVDARYKITPIAFSFFFF